MDAKVNASITLDLLEGWQHGGSSIRKCYFSSNELIPNYLKSFNISGGKVLTVTASGDQAFYSLLAGAKEVDTFDINPLAYYVMELKIGALKTLSSEEYQNFIPCYKPFAKNDDYFNEKTYEKVSKELKRDVKEFWDILYNKIENPKRMLKLSTGISYIGPCTTYYDDENYQVLQQKLETGTITFYKASLFKLPDDIRMKCNHYDGILLSNIYDYAFSFNEQQYINYLNREISPLLKTNGKCLAYYGFGDNINKFKSLKSVMVKDSYHLSCAAKIYEKVK